MTIDTNAYRRRKIIKETVVITTLAKGVNQATFLLKGHLQEKCERRRRCVDYL